MVVRAIPAVVALALACSSKEPSPGARFDGEIHAALTKLAPACRAIGIAEGQPLDKASDLECTGTDVTVKIHLDTSRHVRGLVIDLFAVTTGEAQDRLVPALTPVLNVVQRNHVVAHLDDPMPDSVSPIYAEIVEGATIQAASRIEGSKRRFVLRVRID
jgi:hypothetical protein